MEIRTATTADPAQIVHIESVCFPATEAATPERFAQRLQSSPNHFWVLLEGAVIVGFVNEGVSPSTHGNVLRYQMRLTF